MTAETAHTEVPKPSVEADLAPGTMVGEYQVEAVLGKGGMGKVYSAVHPVIAKRAAIKVLHPQLSMDAESVQRFIQEARSVNQIGHPNIVDIFAFGALPDGRQYFVMECLRGESLRDRIGRGGMPLDEAIAVIETMALPLRAAHEQGIVHRDLKPDNVFLVEVKGDRPAVKLLDFGIAKLLGGDASNRTQTGSMLGTPAYISPEQARGESVDHRTDIYALGALLFELVTGEIVFIATNVADMIAQQLYEPPRSPASLNPNVPAELDRLIVRMLAKEADDRPSLDEICEVLRSCRYTAGAATASVLPAARAITTGNVRSRPAGMASLAPASQPSATASVLPAARAITTGNVSIVAASAQPPASASVLPAARPIATGNVSVATASSQPSASPAPRRGALRAVIALVIVAAAGVGSFLAIRGDRERPSDPAAVEREAVESKAVESKAVESKAVESSIVESKPVDAKPDAKPEAKPEAKPATGSNTPDRRTKHHPTRPPIRSTGATTPASPNPGSAPATVNNTAKDPDAPL